METKNAIVVMLDSWQFNYTGCYGNDWIKTPNIDAFAREGVLFENAYGEGMPTIPVRRALHTGRQTLHETGWSPLRAQDTTLADMCWGTGVDTALVFDCPMYRLLKYGYTRGFDKVYFIHGHEGDHAYYSRKPLVHLDPRNYVSKHILENGDKIVGAPVLEPLLHEISCYLKNRQYWKSEEDQNVPRVMKKAVAYLEDADKEMPFFLWIDSFDPHEPWDGPSVYDADKPCPYDPDYKGVDMFVPLMDYVEKLYTEEELHHIRMLYAEKVTMCDTWFGYLVDNVRRMNLWTNTMMVLISDHGEPMGKGEHGHGIMRKCRPWPYEELVHIPLIIKAPGLPMGTRVPALVQNFDITPTIANWLGIGNTTNMHGIDLWPIMTGKVEKIRDYVISGYYSSAWSLITDDWSYIHWLLDESVTNTIAGLMVVSIDGNQEIELTDDESNIAVPMNKEGMEAFTGYLKNMTLDGAQQWTCTPGAKIEVPARDELYDRRTDPFQLNNVISKHPEKAEEMLRTLRTHMSELKAS